MVLNNSKYNIPLAELPNMKSYWAKLNKVRIIYFVEANVACPQAHKANNRECRITLCSVFLINALFNIDIWSELNAFCTLSLAVPEWPSRPSESRPDTKLWRGLACGMPCPAERHWWNLAYPQQRHHTNSASESSAILQFTEWGREICKWNCKNF